MQNKNIYIDEFGNAHLNLSKEGTFSHFVYASIIINEQDLEKARILRESISKHYFQGHAIKSSSISNNSKGFTKRLLILKELLNLDFEIAALILNKKKLFGPGVGQKEIFYKYFSKILIGQFPKIYTSFKIYADKLGHPEFQDDLKSFINKKATQRDLFNPDRVYTLVEDKIEEPLIQFADFIAGCLGKIYCNSHSHPRSRELFELLYRRLNADFFPYEKTDFTIGNIKEDKNRDAIINRLATISAIDALQNHKKRLSPESKEVLEYLYMVHRSAPTRLIATNEIIERVKILYPTFTKANFRKSIQQLRDMGVLIASIQGKSGYKLPNKLDDIIGFYKRYMGSIVPMISRIDTCNKKIVSNGIILEDILSSDENFLLLKELIHTVKKKKALPKFILE